MLSQRTFQMSSLPLVLSFSHTVDPFSSKFISSALPAPFFSHPVLSLMHFFLRFQRAFVSFQFHPILSHLKCSFVYLNKSPPMFHIVYLLRMTSFDVFSKTFQALSFRPHIYHMCARAHARVSLSQDGSALTYPLASESFLDSLLLFPELLFEPFSWNPRWGTGYCRSFICVQSLGFLRDFAAGNRESHLHETSLPTW